MVDTALRAAGHRSARYTSPHLMRIEERFVIDGREVSTDALEDAALLVQRTAEDLVATGALETLPTFFESTTAAAFVLFREAQVDIAVLEVGLGGRLDATNVVTPMAAAIVSIDIDHEAQLGTSIAGIAAEKAGVIKPGIPVVCGPLPPEALAVIEGVCAERHARLIRTDLDGRLAARVAAIPLSLPGEHQRANAAVAMQVLELIDGDDTLDLPVSADAMRAGLMTASWPGRLERFTLDGCRVLVDAAHNPAGMAATVDAIKESFDFTRLVGVVGVVQGKDVHGMLTALEDVCAEVVVTQNSSPRAMPADELGALAVDVFGADRVSVSPKLSDAIGEAMELAEAGPDDALGGSGVLVTGSVITAGEARTLLAGRSA
jgi:dihydrofolate synthase / folylpolyglutamate synthase